VITVLGHYLDTVKDNLKLAPEEKQEVLKELESHIEDRFQEFRETGLSEEEAASKCLGLVGSSKLVARNLYEAHSQGSWKQTVLASMPHLLFGLLFALNWWRGVGWFSGALVLIVSAVLYFRWRTHPAWLFPWLGYSLVPLLAAGLLLAYLPRVWSWLAIVLYIPLVLWLVGSIVIQTVKRDWLYSTLMLLPLPVILSWILAAGSGEDFPESALERLSYFAPWIAVSFLLLGATTAAFIRIRQRLLKIATLLVLGLLTLVMVAYYIRGVLYLPSFLLLVMLMLSLFLVPYWVERKMKYGGAGAG